MTEERQGRDPFQEAEVTPRNPEKDADSRGLKDLCFPEGKSGDTWFCDMRWLSRIVKYPWIRSEAGTRCVNLRCGS